LTDKGAPHKGCLPLFFCKSVGGEMVTMRKRLQEVYSTAMSLMWA